MIDGDIRNNIYCECAFLTRIGTDLPVRLRPLMYSMFHVYGKHKNNKKLKSLYGLHYWA